MSKLKYFIPAAVLMLVPLSVCFAEVSGDGESWPASLSIIGISIALFIICAVAAIALFIFRYSGRMKSRKAEIKQAEQEARQQVGEPAKIDPPAGGEIYAAISMALYLYSNELHDQENPVITMIRTSKTYSPWSSKIYSLRRIPR